MARVATIGFFDGVHLGHRFLIEQVCEAARERGMRSAVVTFPVHPRKVLCSDFMPCLLTTCDEKMELLAASGVDDFLLSPFSTAIAHLSACEFMALLKERYDVRVLVIGHDHRFGRNRSEGFDDYVRHGRTLGMEVLLARAYPYNIETTVSSSLIRSLLQERGDVAEAARLLGHAYTLQGTVVGGYRVGRRIGFPTANLQVTDPDKLIPADGVYAVHVSLGETRHGGMLSIGRRPTLDNGTERSIEVHIFDFHSDIYDCPLQLSFIARTRDELRFPTVEALTRQLHADEAEIRAILGKVH